MNGGTNGTIRLAPHARRPTRAAGCDDAGSVDHRRCRRPDRPDHYYVHAHGLIHGVIVRMQASGKAVDIATLGAELVASQLAAEIGGLEYLFKLHDSAPCAGNYREYARIIVERADARRNTGTGPRKGATIVTVITDFLQARYRRYSGAAKGSGLTRSSARSAARSMFGANFRFDPGAPGRNGLSSGQAGPGASGFPPSTGNGRRLRGRTWFHMFQTKLIVQRSPTLPVSNFAGSWRVARCRRAPVLQP